MKQDETRLCSPSVRLVIRFSVCMGSPCVILFLFVYLVPVQNTMAQTSKQVRLAAPSILRIRALRPYSPYSGTLCQLIEESRATVAQGSSGFEICNQRFGQLLFQTDPVMPPKIVPFCHGTSVFVKLAKFLPIKFATYAKLNHLQPQLVRAFFTLLPGLCS